MNKFEYIFFAGLLIWTLETAYFGFNDSPANGTERMFDMLSIALVGYGAIGGIVRANAPKVVIKLSTSPDAGETQ